MPFSNYSELKQSIIDYSHRRDIDLKVDDFISLAEKSMYNPPILDGRPVEPLRIKQLEVTDTLTVLTTTPFVSLPSNYAELRNTRLDIVNETDFLEYRAPEQMRRFDDDAGRPCFFTVIGNQIELDRTPDEAFDIEIQYYSVDAALTSSNTTNLVLTNHPELYLYGSLFHLYIFANDPEMTALYKGEFIASLEGANKADKRGRYGPSPVMKVAGSTP